MGRLSVEDVGQSTRYYGICLVNIRRARVRSCRLFVTGKIWLGFFLRIIYVHAYLVIGLWFVYQFLLAFTAVESGVAYWAHIGGFVAGLVLIEILARRRHRHPLYYR